MNWTKEQEQAIYEKGNNILVAAAAGSGKTAVLVERIINKIVNERMDIDKILVVTFTNAAASEMRERILDAIYKKLEENPDDVNLQRQITLLNKSSICTIDSFCLDVVRNNFYELDNISPNFRIADTAEIELLKQEVIEKIFEDKYESQNEDFAKLITTYTSYRDDTPLKEIVQTIYTYIQSNPFPEKWINEKIEMFNLEKELEKDFSETVWGETLLHRVEETLIEDITKLQDVEESLSYDAELDTFQKIIEDDIEKLQLLKQNINNWDKAVEIYSNLTFAIWSRKKVQSEIKEEAKAIRDNVKSHYVGKNAQLSKILIASSKEVNTDIFEMYEILTKLKNLILEFGEEFAKAKREKNILDFSDIEHFALQILLKQQDGKIEQSEIAKKYMNKFEEIAIDEYQDSNLVQEYILTSVSRGNNMFMVGDVKQSIYKFRQAMPELFLSKYESYASKKIEHEGQAGRVNLQPGQKAQNEQIRQEEQANLQSEKIEQENLQEKENPQAGDLKIQLFKNFRSRGNVLDFTNLVFENIMSNLLGDIEYNEEEFLNLGASYEDAKQNLKTEINIISIEKEESEKDIEEFENAEDGKSISEFENSENIKNIGEFKNVKSIGEFEHAGNTKNSEYTDDEEHIEDIELEARFVASKIKEMIDSKFKVYDSKKQEFRNITYKDIVILLRSTATTAPIYEQEILKLQMPVFSDSSSQYLDSIEIETMMALLRIIDNPVNDIPLITVLRSNIGGFTDNDLVDIRLCDKYSNFYTCLQKARVQVDEKLREKIKRFMDNLDMWRKEQEYLALDELIWKIYSDTDFYNYVGKMPNGELRQANLKLLFEKAKQYETASFKGLYNFIKFVDKLRINNGDLNSAKIIGENDNVIRIMSIHKSKGLEFPVVFLSSTGKQFNLMDLNKNILLHQEMGIGVKYIDYEGQLEYDTLTKAAIKEKMLNENLSEEMRVLYVALTRAKEKIIITGIKKDYPKKNEKMEQQISLYPKTFEKINPILIKQYKTFLDWILLVCKYNENKIEDEIDINIIDKKDVIKKCMQLPSSQNTFDSETQGQANQKADEAQEQINKDASQINQSNGKGRFKYKYELATRIPTKTSVTKIKQMELEQLQDLEELMHEVSKTKEVAFSGSEFIKGQHEGSQTKEITFSKPEFIKTQGEEKITGAQKGTLIHLCMQKLNPKKQYDMNEIKKLINELLDKQIISIKEAEAINPIAILQFTKSNIWKELTEAEKIQQEKPFYINIPAKEIYKEETEEKILVQGIIDLYYKNKYGEYVLVDYKTDYAEKGEEQKLVERYKKQLELYKRALEGALKTEVKKCYIYSTWLGEIEVSIEK